MVKAQASQSPVSSGRAPGLHSTLCDCRCHRGEGSQSQNLVQHNSDKEIPTASKPRDMSSNHTHGSCRRTHHQDSHPSQGVSAGLDRPRSWACVFHVEGCRAVAQLCQAWCGSATPRGQASSHVLTTHSPGAHWSARRRGLGGGSAAVWLTHLEAGIRASRLVSSCGANARRGAQLTDRPAPCSTRERDPVTPEAGDQLKPPGAGIDTQNNPRLFLPAVCVCLVPCRALGQATHDPIAGAASKVDMPNPAGSSYRGSSTT